MNKLFVVLCNALVNAVAEIEHRALLSRHHNWRAVVGNLALGLGVDAHERHRGPHAVEQKVEIPVLVRRDRHAERHAIQQIELFDCNLVGERV